MNSTPLCRNMSHSFYVLFALCLQSEFVHIELDRGVLEQIDSTFARVYRQVGQKQVLLPLGWKYQRDRQRETHQSVQCCRKHQNQPLPSLHKVSVLCINNLSGKSLYLKAVIQLCSGITLRRALSGDELTFEIFVLESYCTSLLLL